MRKYTTLSGFFKAIGKHQFNLNEFNARRTMLNGKYQSFKLSYELRDELLQLFASAIWERGAASKAWKLENVTPCGILRRVWIERRKNGRKYEYNSTYCAGQDYISEIRFIQNYVNTH